ncbi:MAG TPA: LysR family transcriptional regulator [Acetobacteraceae bacterium]|nr:LysR family transcriptional regulator [Acetobacteraceae bacterium]
MIDLNLARVFVTIYETGSVSGAAKRLHVSQPSVSYALSRLRHLLGEPLFTRSREGMTPTVFGTQLYRRFRAAVAEIEDAVASTRSFDPLSSTRRFRLALSDSGEASLLPQILTTLGRLAPNVELEVIEVDIARLDEWLKAGKIDAAICKRCVPAAPTDTSCAVVFTEPYACLVSQRHPRVTTSLSMKQYVAERHVAVMPDSGNHLIESRLRELGHERKIGLRVPHFSALPHIVAASELLVTLPSRMAHLFASQAHNRALPLPFSVPKVQLALYWYEHGGDIIALRWFCETLKDCLADL